MSSDAHGHSRYVTAIIRLRIPLAFLAIGILLAQDWLEGRIPHRTVSALTAPRDAIGLAGLASVLIGAFVRGWAAGVIHKGSQLTRSGPYALVRHPLYLGSLLIAIGFCAIIGDVRNLAVVLAFAGLVYVPKVRSEEREMAARFPEYRAYAAVTPAVIPWRFGASPLAPWSGRQYLHHREYRTILACAVALTVIELVATGVLAR